MIINREDIGSAFSVRFLIAFLDSATKFCLSASVLSLCLLLLAYVYEVVARYFFSVPTSWSYDLSTWFLAVSIMAALPDVTKNKANISIDFLLENLPRRAKNITKKIICLVACVFCLAAAGICFGETLRQFNQHIETNWIIPIPKWWISIVIPIGFGLTGLQFLRLSPMKPESCNKAGMKGN